jgi:thiol-disulfide isomerase/thioredoxin/outer membrane lipoprotein-sorting protein
MRIVLVLALSTSFLFAQAPEPPKQASATVSPALQFLRQVGDKYANARSYWIEAVEEETSTQDLRRSWQKSFLAAAEAPGGKHLFTGRDAMGHSTFVSNGATEWHWRRSENAYTASPVTKESSGEPLGMSDYAASKAKFLRRNLLQISKRLKDARFLPDENVKVNGKTIHCKVVTFNTADVVSTGNLHRTDLTYKYWIDQERKVLVKRSESGQNVIFEPNGRTLPFHEEDVSLFTRSEVDSQFPQGFFTFTPPAEAKLIPKFEDGMPDLKKVIDAMIGKPAPETEFQSEDGKTLKLASLKGKPVLLDFWATWCAPCVEAIPEMIKLNTELKSTSLQWFSVDVQDDAKIVNEFLNQKRVPWINYHDTTGMIANSFHTPGVPAIVLIDAEGKVAFIGSDLSAAHAALAKLGPEYAQVAKSSSNVQENQ